MLLWHTFDDTLEGRLLCGSVPLIAALRYAVVGLGVVADERLIKSTSVCSQSTSLRLCDPNL